MAAAQAAAGSGQAQEMSEEGRTVDSPMRVGKLRGHSRGPVTTGSVGDASKARQGHGGHRRCWQQHQGWSVVGCPVVQPATVKDVREAAKANELRPLHC
jgi:hypothetical protein